MDGGSNDATCSTAKSFKDGRINIYSEPDNGIYDAMNKGIDKSSGEWLLFLGSDDQLYDADVLNNVAPHLLNDLDVVYGEAQSHWPDICKGEWTLEKLEGNRCHQAIFYNRRFFGDKLRYNLKYKILADYDMNLRWFLNKNYKHCYIPIMISKFGDGGISSQVQDSLFCKDVGLNKILYNKGVLTPLYKKRAARQYIAVNPEKKALCMALHFYASFMYLLQKLFRQYQ